MNLDLVKKLVLNECACYSQFLNGIKDYCDKEKEDCRCFIYKDERCGYFERAVLPMNPQKVEINCKKCGKTFLADNYRHQYCEFCKRVIRVEKRYIKSQSTP